MRHLEAQIAQALDDLVPPRPKPEGWEAILAAEAAVSPGRDGRRLHRSGRRGQARKGWLIATAGAGIAVAAAGVLVGVGVIGSTSPATPTLRSAAASLQRSKAEVASNAQRQRHGRPSGGAATPVRTLAAYTHLVRARSESDLPPSVATSITQAAARTGSTVTDVQEPIVGDAAAGIPSVYLITLGTKLCTAIALQGATMSCGEALRQADGSLDAESSIVDGKMFIYGLAANDVSTITVTLASTPQTPGTTVQAQIENNVFVAPLPYDGGPDIGAATVTVTRSDGTTGTVTLPGLSCTICRERG